MTGASSRSSSSRWPLSTRYTAQHAHALSQGASALRSQHAPHLVVPGTCSRRQTAQSCEGHRPDAVSKMHQADTNAHLQTNKQTYRCCNCNTESTAKLFPCCPWLSSTDRTNLHPASWRPLRPPVLNRQVTHPHSQQRVQPGPN
jgi:hypothetical protein